MVEYFAFQLCLAYIDNDPDYRTNIMLVETSKPVEAISKRINCPKLQMCITHDNDMAPLVRNIHFSFRL